MLEQSISTPPTTKTVITSPSTTQQVISSPSPTQEEAEQQGEPQEHKAVLQISPKYKIKMEEPIKYKTSTIARQHLISNPSPTLEQIEATTSPIQEGHVFQRPEELSAVGLEQEILYINKKLSEYKQDIEERIKLESKVTLTKQEQERLEDISFGIDIFEPEVPQFKNLLQQYEAELKHLQEVEEVSDT